MLNSLHTARGGIEIKGAIMAIHITADTATSFGVTFTAYPNNTAYAFHVHTANDVRDLVDGVPQLRNLRVTAELNGAYNELHPREITPLIRGAYLSA